MLACQPGDTRQCVGPGACDGGQACDASGQWSACDCGSATAGEGGTSGSAGSSQVGGESGAPGGSGSSLGGEGGAGGEQPQDHALWSETFAHVAPNTGVDNPSCKLSFAAVNPDNQTSCFLFGNNEIDAGTTGVTEFLAVDSPAVPLSTVADCSRNATFSVFRLSLVCSDIFSAEPIDYPRQALPVGTVVTRVVRDIASNSWGSDVDVRATWTIYGL